MLANYIPTPSRLGEGERTLAPLHKKCRGGTPIQKNAEGGMMNNTPPWRGSRIAPAIRWGGYQRCRIHPRHPSAVIHPTPPSPLLRRHPTPAPSSPHCCHLRAGGDPVPLPPIPDSLSRCCYHYCPAPNFRLDGGQKYRIKTFTLNFF